ncbi:MAG: hypothetical protein QW286_01735 [Candidatus Aenigmatarchaeota archaeon]
MGYDKLNHGLWERTLKEIYNSGFRELALTVHSIPDCSCVSPEKRELYIEKNREFLKECRRRKIPVIDFFSDEYEIGLIDYSGRHLIYEADASGCPECHKKICNKSKFFI